jgi:hypothetical protein
MPVMSLPADNGQRISVSKAPQDDSDWAKEMFNSDNLAAFMAFQKHVEASEASINLNQQRLEDLA